MKTSRAACGTCQNSLKTSALDLVVPAEVAAALPALGLADRADHRLQRLARAVRIGETAGDDVLQAQQLIRAGARGDVLGDAAVALEALLRVEHGLAARADVARIALRIDALVDEVGEGLSRLEQGPVRLPASVVAEGHGAALPARGPEEFARVAPGLLEHRAADQGEAVVFVLLPVPLRRELEVAAEALVDQPKSIRGREPAASFSLFGGSHEVSSDRSG